MTPARQPEIGFVEVDTSDPVLVPAGPWTAFHVDVLEPPADATVVARNECGVQAFVLPGALGVQFHPEVRPDVLDDWSRRFPDLVLDAGLQRAKPWWRRPGTARTTRATPPTPWSTPSCRGWRRRCEVSQAPSGVRARCPVLVGPERAQLELAAVGLRVSRGDRDRLVEVVASKDVEAGDPLFRLGERPIGDENLAAADSDRGGFADRAQGITSDALPAAVDVGQPLIDGQVVRGRSASAAAAGSTTTNIMYLIWLHSWLGGGERTHDDR